MLGYRRKLVILAACDPNLSHADNLLKRGILNDAWESASSQCSFVLCVNTKCEKSASIQRLHGWRQSEGTLLEVGYLRSALA